MPMTEVPMSGPLGPSSDLSRARELFGADARKANADRKAWARILDMNWKKKKVTREDIAAGYGEELDKFIAKECGGDASKEQMALAKWHLLHTPASAASKPGLVTIDLELFVTARDAWVRITEESEHPLTVQKINQWDEIQKQAAEDIGRMSRGTLWTFDDFCKTRDKWVAAGVMTLEDANKLPEVRKNACYDIERRAGMSPVNISNFLQAREQWIGEGILSDGEANMLPGVQQAAQKDIQTKTAYPYDEERWVKMATHPWIEAGVIQAQSAEA